MEDFGHITQPWTAQHSHKVTHSQWSSCWHMNTKSKLGFHAESVSLEQSLSPFFYPFFMWYLQLFGPFPSAVCVVASPRAVQRRLLMQGFIYLTDLLLEGKDYGGSCRGAEGTAVPQCSVPHYCFLMRRSEGLQQVSPSGHALHDSQCCSSYLWWCSGFRWGTCVWRRCFVLKTYSNKIKNGFSSHAALYFHLSA